MTNGNDIVARLRRSVTKGHEPSDQDAIDAITKIERLRAALQRVVDHDPKTPGLHYDSIEQLLESAIGCARAELSDHSQGVKGENNG